jgi:hypothetical protein
MLIDGIIITSDDVVHDYNIINNLPLKETEIEARNRSFSKNSNFRVSTEGDGENLKKSLIGNFNNLEKEKNDDFSKRNIYLYTDSVIQEEEK